MIWTTAALLVTLAFASASTDPLITKSTYPVVGGITDTDVNIPVVRDALNFAVGKLNRQNPYMSGVVEVIKATSQVVAGYMYRFEVVMSILGCKPWSNMMDCRPQLYNSERNQSFTCYFEVWSKPRMGTPQLMKNDCHYRVATRFESSA